MDLTVKQERFCQNIMKGMSQRDAYKDAYNCGNMKKNTIDRNASVLRHSPKIDARIRELEQEVREKSNISVEAIIEELAHIAFDDIGNYIEFGSKVKQTIQNEDGTVEPVFENYVVFKESAFLNTKSIQEVKMTGNGALSLKMYPKDQALVNLGRIFGLFVEKFEGYIEGDMSDEDSVKHRFSEDNIRAAYEALYKQIKPNKSEDKKK